MASRRYTPTLNSSSAPSKVSPLSTLILEKRQELEMLQQMKDLSGNMISQLEQLQEKLATLADGTKSVAFVLSNWSAIRQAVSLASLSLQNYSEQDYEQEQPMPETLVRIRVDGEEEEQE